MEHGASLNVWVFLTVIKLDEGSVQKDIRLSVWSITTSNFQDLTVIIVKWVEQFTYTLD